MRIGELARRARTTVRTLHHYDEIGLLRPSGRSEAGYRLYSRDDIERLACIRAMRLLGMPLERIREALEAPGRSLSACLSERLRELDAEIEARAQARDRLRTILAEIDGAASPSIETLTATLEVIEVFEKYYTPDQMEYLRKRREEVGEDRIRQVEQEWRDVFAGYREAMEQGLDPADPKVQALAKKSRELIGEFTGGDVGVERSLTNLYEGEGAQNVLGHRGFECEPELWEYMARAREAAG